MENDGSDLSDSDNTDSEGEPKIKGLNAMDENTINLSAMLMKD
jgi:hypothetical protein